MYMDMDAEYGSDLDKPRISGYILIATHFKDNFDPKP